MEVARPAMGLAAMLGEEVTWWGWVRAVGGLR